MMSNKNSNKKSNKKKVSFLVLGIVLVFLTTTLQAQIFYGAWDYGNYTRYNTTHMAMYNFNEGWGTTTHDDSGRNKTGFLYGTSWVQEKDMNLVQNAALYFNGGGAFVRVPNYHDFNIPSTDVNGFTISAMIKVPTDLTKAYHMICSKYQYLSGRAYGFTFYLDNGNLRFTAYDGADQANIQNTGQDLRDNQWHFVAVEYLNGTYRLFIDPTETFNGQVCSLKSSVQPANNTEDFFIGRRNVFWDYDKDFLGTIDSLYFYEIEPELMLNPPQRMWGFNNEGYWSFDEGNDTPDGIVNDLVRWTSYNAGYHNYGKIYGTEFNFLDRTYAWKGEHCAEFNNAGTPNTGIRVDDPTNRLDFAAYPGAEDLYIEFLFWPSNNDLLQYTPLIEKYDYTPGNGYRVYFIRTSNDSSGYLNFEVANNGSTGCLTTNPNTFGNGWIHVWAWAQNGVLHLMIMNETLGICFPEYIQPIDCGIGATSSPLFFGSGLTSTLGQFYDGRMDEIIIGHCFPGLEH